MSIAALAQGTSSRSPADAQPAAFSYPKSRFETDDRIRACTWQSFKERSNWNVLPRSQWRLFPGHPRLKTGESLNSWFSRLAHANGLSELSLTEMIFSVARAPKIDWDTLCSDSALACLAFCGGVADLQSHSLGYSLPGSPSSYWPKLIEEFVVMRFSGRSRATQVCLDCLADHRILKLEWRLATHTFCELHQRWLIKPCERCASDIDAIEDVASAMSRRATSCSVCREDYNLAICDRDAQALGAFQQLIRSMISGYRANERCQRFLSGLAVLINIRDFLEYSLGEAVDYVMSDFPGLDAPFTEYNHTLRARTCADRRDIVRWIALALVRYPAKVNQAIVDLGNIAEHDRMVIDPEFGDPFMEALFAATGLRRDRPSRDYREPFKLRHIKRLTEFFIFAQKIWPPQMAQPRH